MLAQHPNGELKIRNQLVHCPPAAVVPGLLLNNAKVSELPFSRRPSLRLRHTGRDVLLVLKLEMMPHLVSHLGIQPTFQNQQPQASPGSTGR